MKRLSISLAAACCMLSISAWTYFSTPTAEKTASKAQALYYWFSYPDDTYNDHATTDDEAWELWIYYGVNVSTNSSGGTLVSRGYTSSAYPHTTFASVYLYAHY